MLSDLKPYLEAQQGPLTAALAALVRVPSVCDEGAGGYPFGPAIDLALRQALEVAAQLGFRTHYDDGGYYGWAEIGEGSELLGILGHLDVVPPGRLEDWTYGPFEPVERDGVLYGRGTQDDKGGTLAALFAVKALLDAGIRFNKRVRFIFGVDEENLWRCIKRYNEIEERPGLGFSPDARFPLVFAEKGLLQFELVGRNESGLRFHGGSAFNAVPDAIAIAFPQAGMAHPDRLTGRLDELGFPFTRSAQRIEVHGKAAHTMEAEKGVNAIARLCMGLDAAGVQSGAVSFVAREVGEDARATRIFGEVADEPTGAFKLNVGKIDFDEQERLSMDCRIPVTVPKDAIVAQVTSVAARYGLEYREFDWLAPLYLPLDHFLVRTLMRVYQEVTGDLDSQPIASGGATYARAMPNCVAFGALLHDELLTEHQPDERVRLANLYKAMEIYAHAIRELTQ